MIYDILDFKKDELYNFLKTFNITYNDMNVEETNKFNNVIEYNKNDLKYAISDIKDWINKFNIKNIAYKLRKKFEKRIKILDYNYGVLTYIEANIDNQGPIVADNSRVKIYVPFSINIGEFPPLAYVVLQDYVRLEKFQQKIRIMESLLKRSKVQYDKVKYKKDKKNVILFKVKKLDDNEKFFRALELLGK